MATGWAGVRKATARQELRCAVDRLTDYFFANIELEGGGERNRGHIRNTIRNLLKDHNEADVRGLLEDVAFLTEESRAGRQYGGKRFIIMSPGLLPHLMERYDPKTKRIGDIWGRTDEFFDSSDLVAVG